MDRSNLEKIAQTPEDKLLLSRIFDKLQRGMARNIPASSSFLSLREQALCQYLFGTQPGLHYFGGHENAERKMLIYLPDYLEESSLMESGSPVACLHARFYEGDTPTHRDFLGALTGAGIVREAVGDICVGQGFCDFFVTEQIAPFLLQEFQSAGRTRLRLTQIPLSHAAIPEPEVQEIKDTLSSLRLDSVVSAGFRMSRGLAAQHIAAGRAAIDGLPCEKPDRTIREGASISLRGFGKIKLVTVGGLTKKERISVVIHRYV